jgi:hypothetical protein
MYGIISARLFLLAVYFHLFVSSVDQPRKETERLTLEKHSSGAPAISNGSKLGAPGGAAPNGPESRSAGV